MPCGGSSGDAAHPLHYLAIPPALFSTVIDNLKRSDCAAGRRIIVEKPFGRDLASARALNATVHRAFGEASIFRIDHYLGKEPVQNLLYFRFANSFLEPIWNATSHVASIQITMAEAVRRGRSRRLLRPGRHDPGRGPEPSPPGGQPAGDGGPVGPRRPRRSGTSSSRSSIRFAPFAPDDVVRGQYRGYRSVAGVAPDSTVETFAALRFHLDTWRWGGVPIYVRAGKALPVTATEVLVELRQPPQMVFPEVEPPDGNYLRFRLSPDMSISLAARAKRPGEAMLGEAVELFARHQSGEERPPYQRLIGDARRGDQALFAREDSVEAAWRVIDPVLHAQPPIHEYVRGSWGPAAAAGILAPGDHWHDPTDPEVSQ